MARRGCPAATGTSRNWPGRWRRKGLPRWSSIIFKAPAPATPAKRPSGGASNAGWRCTAMPCTIAAERPEINEDRLALVGYSLGALSGAGASLARLASRRRRGIRRRHGPELRGGGHAPAADLRRPWAGGSPACPSRERWPWKPSSSNSARLTKRVFIPAKGTSFPPVPLWTRSPPPWSSSANTCPLRPIILLPPDLPSASQCSMANSCGKAISRASSSKKKSMRRSVSSSSMCRAMIRCEA